MKRNSKIGIALLVLLLAVGFAAVTTSLIINNNVVIGSNQQDFDVIFSKATTDTGGTAVISANKKEITFNTKQLSTIGDIATLDYEVTNNSREYDAYVTVEFTNNDTTYNDYYEINHEYPNNVPGKETKPGKITIKLLKAPTNNIQTTFRVVFNVTATERTSGAEPSTPAQTSYTIVSGDLDTVGSEVCIGTECFYVIGKEGTNTKLFAKWNLKVGYVFDHNTYIKINEYTTSDPGYGLQDKDMLGSTMQSSTINGTLPFSDTNYWTYTDGKPYVYNNESKLYQYIENYVNYLNQQGVSVSGRLIKYEELQELGYINLSSCDSLPSWLYSTAYWTGSAGSTHSIYSMYYGCALSDQYYPGENSDGVRPVIILEP